MVEIDQSAPKEFGQIIILNIEHFNENSTATHFLHRLLNKDQNTASGGRTKAASQISYNRLYLLLFRTDPMQSTNDSCSEPTVHVPGQPRRYLPAIRLNRDRQKE